MYPYPSAMMLGGGWTLPGAAKVGSDGTLTKAGATWTAAGMGDETFAYITRPMSAGRFYWEFEILTAQVLPGIADDIATPVDFGGYTTTNGGVYSASGAFWRESGWGGTFSGGSLGALSAGDILGFAYDADAGALEFFLDGVSVNEITFTSPPATAYAHAGFQSAGSGRFRLGPAGCVHPRPAGYGYL